MTKKKMMVIQVQYLIEDPKGKFGKKRCEAVAAEVENLLTNPPLGKYLWTLGDYVDSQVTEILEISTKE